MAGQELFLEIGVEEMPAGYIIPAGNELATLLQKRLEQALISCGDAKTFSTPRRLGVVIQDVATSGEDRTNEMIGPPTRVAFDKDGAPRVPAQKFAEKVGLPLDQIERKEMPKGEYLVAHQVEKGKVTVAFLNEVIPETLRQLSFPKVMRWGAESQAFARPVHWLCARLGDQPLTFAFASINSGTQSRGHRFLAPDNFEVESFAQYEAQCRKQYVLIDPEERKKIIIEQGNKLAQEVGAELWKDDALFTLNANLTEYPVPLVAHYEEHYLSLPKELLRTSMKNHLKCFALVDREGELVPHFMAVANLPSTDEAKVRSGFQRVLRARLADAEFFYREDHKKTLDTMGEKLDRVIYQSKLGSYGDKVRRVTSQVATVAKELGLPDATTNAQRAATLYKADLASEMVYEFPELQGIMGKYYAIHQEEEAEVAEAIQEHYLPAGQDDPLPQTDAGKVLAIAERLDTLVGGFGAGLKPTGSADPYALRRQAIGLLRILKEHELSGRLSHLLDAAAKPLSGILEDTEAITQDVLQFLLTRLVQILRNDGWPRDQVDAVCVISLIGRYPLVQLNQLLEALQEAVQSGLLAGLAYSFKRVNNILKAAAKKGDTAPYPGLGSLLFQEEAPAIDTSLLEAEVEAELNGIETTLFQTYESVRKKVEQALANADFRTGLQVLLELREPIDNMLGDEKKKGVRVNAKDDALRTNRLQLMRGIARLAFLDFSRIDTTEAEK